MNYKLNILFAVYSISVATFYISHANAQSGTLDLSFGVDGFVITNYGKRTDIANGMVIQPDGKILVVGGTSTNGSSPDFAMSRYNPNGTLDNSFGVGGIFLKSINSPNQITKAVNLQKDGKIIVGLENSNLERYLSNGKIDSSFGIYGTVIPKFQKNIISSYLSTIITQSDEKIITVGSARDSQFNWIVLNRYNSNGSLDSSFGTNGILITNIRAYSLAYSVDLQIDRKIIISGVDMVNNKSTILIMRFRTDGNLDSSFGINGILSTSIGTKRDADYTIKVQTDGYIVIAGNSENESEPLYIALLRINSNGSIDSTFGTNGIIKTLVSPKQNTLLRSMTIQKDGKILVSGVSFISPNFVLFLQRFNNSGTIDSSFGVNGTAALFNNSLVLNPTSLALQNDGKIVLSGNQTPPSSPSSYDIFVLRLNNTITGLNEESKQLLELCAAPNPFHSTSSIDLKHTLENGTLIFYNMYGIKVKTIKNISGKTLTIQRDQLSSGIYHIQLFEKNMFIAEGKILINN
ncbi:MAG: hypothetical protein IPK88_01235 [Saprospiraceae bacterium]|nr:hypothetical protein [Candidatus Defluviibacterium haderslevense]